MKTAGIALMMVVAAATAVAGKTPEEVRQLTICMVSPPGSDAIVNGAKAVASGIFAGIGVKIQWRGPGKCPAEALYVSFSIETPVNQLPGAFAYALPFEGTHIVVFLDRVKTVMAPSAVPCLLGYTLAHEITHILEGQARHSASGIMKAHWEAADYFEMRQGRLGFAAVDVSLIYHAGWNGGNRAIARE
jgi:hypothetical protein